VPADRWAGARQVAPHRGQPSGHVCTGSLPCMCSR
jgi:hypothetical protein